MTGVQKHPLKGTPVPGGAVQQPDQGPDPEGLLETRQRLDEEDWPSMCWPHKPLNHKPESGYQRRTQPQKGESMLELATGHKK